MSFCCCDSGNEERMKKRIQRDNQKRAEEENNARRERQLEEGRELGAQVYKQLNATNNGKMLSFYGRPMNLQNEQKELDLPTKSEVERYSNQHEKEEGFIAQGNIYENQGYHYKGDIYGNNKRFNNEDKKKENNKKETKNDSQITLNIYKKPGERKYW